MNPDILVNKKLTESELRRIESYGSDESPVVFAIIGDVSGEGVYSRSVFAATESELFVFDLDRDDPPYSLKFSDIQKIFTKRMYGNAFIRVILKGEDKPRNIFRYTLSIAQLCDSAILFVSNIIGGADPDEQAGIIAATYEKQLSVCPKCGSRNLTKIERMNGYLSYSRVKGDTRLNDAKMAEIAERKSM